MFYYKITGILKDEELATKTNDRNAKDKGLEVITIK